MSQLENLREKLHKMIEAGKFEDILRLSQELDKLILYFYQENKQPANKKSA